MPNGITTTRLACPTRTEPAASAGLETITHSARWYSARCTRPYVAGAHEGRTRSLWCHTTSRGAGVRRKSAMPAIGFGSCNTTQSARRRHNSSGSDGQSGTDAALPYVATRTTSTLPHRSRMVVAQSLAATTWTFHSPAVPSQRSRSTVSMPPPIGGYSFAACRMVSGISSLKAQGSRLKAQGSRLEARG